MQSLYIDNNATEQVLQINRAEQEPGGVGWGGAAPTDFSISRRLALIL